MMVKTVVDTVLQILFQHQYNFPLLILQERQTALCIEDSQLYKYFLHLFDKQF